MRLEIQIQMDNAAFGDSPQEAASETAIILRKLADRCEQQGCVEASRLMDSNGNAVGVTSVYYKE